MSGKTRRSIDLAYIVSPSHINSIAQRLEDIAPSDLPGVTLILRGDTHWLFLTCAGKRVADRVRMRMREFFETDVRESPGISLDRMLSEGFDRIIPGNAFPVWRECGWEGGMTAEEALKKAEELAEGSEG